MAKEEIRPITYWIDYFIKEALPNITQEEVHTICDIIKWPEEKKSAFMLAVNIFEDQEF